MGGVGCVRLTDQPQPYQGRLAHDFGETEFFTTANGGSVILDTGSPSYPNEARSAVLANIRLYSFVSIQIMSELKLKLLKDNSVLLFLLATCYSAA
jgi:hypothetical protein